MILDHRRLAKLMQAYVMTLPSHIRQDRRVHPSILLDGARSGRLSMHDPSMHQIPSRGGEAATLVKSCFVAEDGYTLVQGDYKTLEIYIAALLSKDETMLNTLYSGLDYHLETTKRISQRAWGLTPEQIAAEFEAGDEEHRNVGKKLNFSVLYGQGPRAVAEEVGCSEEVAKVLLDSLFAAYPQLKQWILECKAEARGTGYTYTYWDGQVARRRPVLDAGFKDSDRRGHAERAAFNSRIQGTASDFCLMSVVVLNQFFAANKWPARVVLTVHDSIIVECRQDIVKEVAAKMNEVMSGWPSGDLRLKIDFKYGPVWGDVQKLKL
jgi:DNA polymerase-1